MKDKEIITNVVREHLAKPLMALFSNHKLDENVSYQLQTNFILSRKGDQLFVKFKHTKVRK